MLTEEGRMKGLFDLAGKVAVITGGSSGIGLGFARGIARHGGDVAIWARSEEKMARAKEDLSSLGVQVLTRQVDVAREDELIAAYDDLLEQFGRVDMVFANAGLPPVGKSVLDIEAADYHAFLDVSMHGAFFTLREGARRMVQRALAGEPGGSLVFCGSLSMFQGLTHMSAYAAAKAGIGAMIRSMAVELGQYGIRANSIVPGFTWTGMTESADAREDIDQYFRERTPLARSATPADFEAIAAYLASDGASFHTGDTITIDGGQLVNM
jgi:NAD(P)-dependent dehydrogenase (short-subunit alcohol dehydrogenase family)